jgi:hypothetical protein
MKALSQLYSPEPTPGLEPGTARLQGEQLVPAGLSMPRNSGLNAVIAGIHGWPQQEFMDKLMDSQSAWTIAPPSSRASWPTPRVEQAVLAPPQKDDDLPLAVAEIAASPLPVTLFTPSAMGARSGGKVALECLAAGDAAVLALGTAVQPLVQLGGLVRRPAVRQVLLSTWSVSSSGCSV